MDGDPLDKRLADGLGRPAADALAEWAQMKGLSFRLTEWFANGRSSATVAAVFERLPGQGAQKLILKHDTVDSDLPGGPEYRRHAQARKDAPEFAEDHISPPVHDPIRVGDGTWITFQQVAGGSFDEYRVLTSLLAGVPGAVVSDLGRTQPVRCDRGTFGDVCAGVVASILMDWAEQPDVKPMSVAELLDRHLLHRLRPGEPLHRVAADWPGRWITLPGESRRLPNPFALARDLDRTGDVEVAALVGRAHGDLHPENILVRVSPAIVGTDHFLIDLSRYQPAAPLTRDPVQLVLTIVGRTMGELSEPQRDALIDVLLDPGAERAAQLPAWLPDLVTRVRDTALSWVRPWGLVDEWRCGSVLSTVACALMFLGRRTTPDAHRLWYLRLAARASEAFLSGTGVQVRPDRQGISSVSPTRVPATAQDDTVARLCLHLPGLRSAAQRKGRTDDVAALVAAAKMGRDISAAYGDLVRGVDGPDEDVRHGLPSLGGGRPVTGEVFVCPLAVPCGREARRRPSGGEPACHLRGGAMTAEYR